jgi:low affinity Fe/Cu permease
MSRHGRQQPEAITVRPLSRAAQWTSQQCGRAYTFVGAIVIIAAWAVSGPDSLHQTQFVAELEERQTLWSQSGKLEVLYWLSRGNLGTYSDALALAAATGTTPSTRTVANYRSKYGVAIGLRVAPACRVLSGRL